MKDVTFRFDEFDEAIDEAIEDDIKEADGGGAGGEPRVCLQRAKISKEFFNICLEFSFLDFHELD